MIHQSRSWEYIWRKSQLEKIHAPQCSLQHYLQKLGRGKWKWSRSVMSNSATPWTVAYQASPSMRFSRQEYRSGLPFPSLGIFLTQGSNLSLPHAGRRFTLYATREAAGHGSNTSTARLDEDAVHINNGTSLSHREGWNSAICSDMDEPRECHSKGSKSDRENKLHVILLICRI